MTHTPSSAASLRAALVPFGGLWAGRERAGARRMLKPRTAPRDLADARRTPDPLMEPADARRILDPIVDLLARCRAGAQRRRAKRQLLALDERMLKDIGYTRSDVLWYAVRHAADRDLLARCGHARD